MFLYIDFNSFFASCEQQADPALREKPVAVVPTITDTTCCIAASYQAKKWGVKTGVSVKNAKKMCPGIIFKTGNHELYVKYHHRLIEAVDQCLPIHSICSIDEIACELTGTQKNNEVARLIALKIKKTIHEQVGEVLTSSIGVGPNILLSKMAADMQKPDGLTFVNKSDLPKRLFDLNLQDVPGIGSQMNLRLHRMGVRTMEQLLALSEQQMKAAWGSIVGSRYYYLLQGEHIELERGSTKSIGHEHVLPPDDRTWFRAQIVAQRLLSKAAIRLRRSELLAKRLHIYVKYYNEVRWEDVSSFDETQDTGFLLKKIKELYQYAPKKEKPIKVAITLSDFVSSKNRQLSFFDNPKRSQLFNVVDKINEKFGRDTIYAGSLHESLESAPTRIAFSRIPNLDEV